MKKIINSNVFDEYVSLMLKKKAGGKGEAAGDAIEFLFDLSDEVSGAGKAVEKAAPKVPTSPVPATAPTTPTPPKSPSSPKKTPSTSGPSKATDLDASKNLEAAKKAGDEIAIQAGMFHHQLRMLVEAMEETIESGKVLNPQNPFFRESADNIMRRADDLLSDEVFGTWISKLEEISSSIPKQYSSYKKVVKAIEALKSQRIIVIESQRKFRQHLSKLSDEALKSTENLGKTEETFVSNQKELDLIEGLTEELSNIYKDTILNLQEIVGKLSSKNEELIKDLLKKSKDAGYWKGVAKTLEDSNLQNTSEYRIIKEVVEDSSRDVIRTSERVSSEIPNPIKTKPIIDNGTSRATSEGITESKKALEVSETKSVKEQKTITETNTTAPKKENNRPIPDQNNRNIIEESSEDKAPGILNRALNYISSGSSSSKGIKAGTSLLLFGAIGIAGVTWYFTRGAGQEIKSSLESAISKSIALLTNGNIQFTEGSNGLLETNDLISIYRDGLVSLNSLSIIEDEKGLREAASSINDVQVESEEYLNDELLISEDLVLQVGWDEAITSIQEVKRLSKLFGITLLQDAEKAKAESNVSQNENTFNSGVTPGLSGPIAKPAETSEEEFTTEKIPGTNIELNYENAPQKSAGFRSATRAIIKRVLTAPVGLAFVDPEGAVWTGALTRSSKYPDENYYWRTISYLYEHGINTPGKLRRHMRHQLDRWKRGKDTAWRDALKYYRGRVSNKYSMDLYLDNIIKSSKLQTFSKTSINNNEKVMKVMEIKKFSDEHSNSYVQDALKGLSDEYAKSYLSGLKSMYDERLGSSDDIKNDLYHPNGGSGVETLSSAHPESLTIAESMGKGGLVENLLEQQKGSYEVALSTPTGNFRGKRANFLKALVKEANLADSQGDIELSNLIDEIIVELTNE